MPAKTPRGNRREIAAGALGMDYESMLDYQYQPSTFYPAVYAVGDVYITVGTPSEIAKNSKKLFADRGSDSALERHPDKFSQDKAARHGWVVAWNRCR